MATIKLTNKQLRLIQKSLDLYSRVGILQFEEILYHPTINSVIENRFTKKKKLEVGDNTMRGEIVEIGEKFIKTKGNWGNGEEIKKWTDVEKIKLSPDWDEVYETKEAIKKLMNELKNLISDENFSNGSYGIHSPEADESCREAFDIIQVIRHEFWKQDPNRSSATVDSNISFTRDLDSDDPDVKVELDTIKDIRKQKLNKIEK